MVVTVVPTTTGSTQRSPRWYSHITGIKWEKSGDQVELGPSTNWKTKQKYSYQSMNEINKTSGNNGNKISNLSRKMKAMWKGKI